LPQCKRFEKKFHQKKKEKKEEDTGGHMPENGACLRPLRTISTSLENVN
jgi:hypothetical protein